MFKKKTHTHTQCSWFSSKLQVFIIHRKNYLTFQSWLHCALGGGVFSELLYVSDITHLMQTSSYLNVYLNCVAKHGSG